nr:hypothetical protein [Tanacetum cinerariifolium]
MRDDILEEDMPPRRRFALTGSPPGCDVAESLAAAVARAPRSQYDFVDTVKAGQGLIRSPGHDTRTIARAADRAEDASYVRALHASERRMMTSIKEVNLRVSYQAQVHRQESKDCALNCKNTKHWTISTQDKKLQRKARSGSKFSSNNLTMKLNLSKFRSSGTILAQRSKPKPSKIKDKSPGTKCVNFSKIQEGLKLPSCQSSRPQIPMATFTKALIDAFVVGSSVFPLPPTSPAYDQAPFGHRSAMIRMRDDIPKENMPPWRIFVLYAPPPGCDVAESSAAAARAPRGQYDFVDTVKAGQGLIHSPGHDAWTIARAANRAEDVGYVRALQASEHRMITFSEEVNLRVSYQAQV